MSLGISISKNECIQSSILRGLKEGGTPHSASMSLFSAVLKTGLLILMLHRANACSWDLWTEESDHCFPARISASWSVPWWGSETGAWEAAWAEADLCLGVESALLPPSAFELNTMCLFLHGHLLTRAVTCSDTHLSLLSPEANEV